MKKVIIIAAGRGSRLEHHTDERPKCMVSVGGRSILEHQLAAFSAHQITDLHIIRGYLAEKLVVPGATYYANPDWERNNILHSLFYAEEAMDGPFLSTYSDIVFTADAVEAALQMPGDINLVVDRQWHKAYQGRHDHPVEQAELVKAEGNRVTAVGKHVGVEGAVGEFIGLASYSARGAELMLQTFNELKERLGDDDIFRQGRIFRRAYLADLFEELIERGANVRLVPIDGGWREIDTVQDLRAVNSIWTKESEGT